MTWNLWMGSDEFWCKVIEGKYGTGKIETDLVQVKALEIFIWKVIA